ncbi:hypothetical protein MRS44_000469 [Fusarium solani]|uniref:uncharacterized protein n=1 Tax=Fusarium solani TaxID=169388 RepID=UPI0032C45E8E|nr:hypothetical protein MRS44_000469 [Fusarium solani]
MSIPNEALQKLVREIESQAIAAQQQIGLARTQMTAKQREQRLVKLTLSEMASLPEDAVVYEGVGKMFGCSIPTLAASWLLLGSVLAAASPRRVTLGAEPPTPSNAEKTVSIAAHLLGAAMTLASPALPLRRTL